MLQILRKIIDGLLFSNVFIALAAVCFCLETYVESGMSPHIDLLTTFVFSATLFAYLFTRTDSLRYVQNLPQRLQWLKTHSLAVRVMSIIAMAGMILSFLQLDTSTQIAAIPAGVITILYSIPFVKESNKMVRLREIGFLKVFLIAFVWAYTSTVMVQLHLFGEVMDVRHLLLHFTANFFFIVAITVPFDIRDMQPDRQAGIQTLAVRLGERKTRWLAYGCLSVYWLLNFARFGGQLTDIYTISDTIITLVGFFVIYWAGKDRNEYYYLGVLDGFIILKFVVDWIAGEVGK